MELVSNGVVSLHKLDVVQHHQRVVQAADLQIRGDVLLNLLRLSFVSLCAVLNLNVLQLQALVELVVALLLADRLLILLGGHEVFKGRKSYALRVLQGVLVDVLGKVLVAFDEIGRENILFPKSQVQLLLVQYWHTEVR